MKTCDDCFEEFDPKHKDQIVCETCKPFPKNHEYGKATCVHCWKVFHSRGFKTQIEIDKYQNIKKSYKHHTGRNLPKIAEKLNERIK